MNERLKQIRNYYNMNMREFAAALGMSSGAISMLENGQRNITSQFIKSVLLAFPEIRSEWFETGEGNMLKPRTRESELADLVDAMLSSEPDDIRLRITKVLYDLNEKQIETLYKIGKEMFGNENSPE